MVIILKIELFGMDFSLLLEEIYFQWLRFLLCNPESGPIKFASLVHLFTIVVFFPLVNWNGENGQGTG